jgi:hypothetical protein
MPPKTRENEQAKAAEGSLKALKAELQAESCFVHCESLRCWIISWFDAARFAGTGPGSLHQ